LIPVYKAAHCRNEAWASEERQAILTIQRTGYWQNPQTENLHGSALLCRCFWRASYCFGNNARRCLDLSSCFSLSCGSNSQTREAEEAGQNRGRASTQMTGTC
jgi:hypothetical protein